MNALRKLGPVLFAISMIFFGIQYVRAGSYVGGLPPVPPWAPGGRVGADLTGVLLMAGGASILIGKRARAGATLIAWFFLLCVIDMLLTHWHGVLYDGVDRTRALEPLALSGAAFALISILPSRMGLLMRSPGWQTKLGCCLFAAVVDRVRLPALFVRDFHRNTGARVDSVSFVLGVFHRGRVRRDRAGDPGGEVRGTACVDLAWDHVLALVCAASHSASRKDEHAR
jgi:uncharacterized membrane protein